MSELIVLLKIGGERGIRTLGGLAPTTVFETAPFNHSGTSPGAYQMTKTMKGFRHRRLQRMIYPICRPDATERLQKEVMGGTALKCETSMFRMSPYDTLWRPVRLG